MDNRPGWAWPANHGSEPHSAGPYGSTQASINVYGGPSRPQSNVYEQTPPLPARTPIDYIHAPQLPPRPLSAHNHTQAISSIPAGYQYEVQQNHQGWPQHSQYSNQPPTSYYAPDPHQQASSIDPHGTANQYNAPAPPPKIPGHSAAPSFGSRPNTADVGGHIPPRGGGYSYNDQNSGLHNVTGGSQMSAGQYGSYIPHPSYNSAVNSISSPYGNHPGLVQLPGPPPGPPPDTPPVVTPQTMQDNLQYFSQQPTRPHGPEVQPGGQMHPPYPLQEPYHTAVTTSSAQVFPRLRTEVSQDPVSPVHKSSVDSGRHGSLADSLVSSPLSRPASLVSRMSSNTPFRPPHDSSQPPGPRTPANGGGHAYGNSAFGFGGPVDWQHYGSGEDEIDDTSLYGLKPSPHQNYVDDRNPVDAHMGQMRPPPLMTEVRPQQAAPVTEQKTPTGANANTSFHSPPIIGTDYKKTQVETNDEHTRTWTSEYTERPAVPYESRPVIHHAATSSVTEHMFNGDRVSPPLTKATPLVQTLSREPFLQARIDELQRRNTFLQTSMDDLQIESTELKQRSEGHAKEVAEIRQQGSDGRQQLETKIRELHESHEGAAAELRAAQSQLLEATDAIATAGQQWTQERTSFEKTVADLKIQLAAAETANEQHVADRESMKSDIMQASEAAQAELDDVRKETSVAQERCKALEAEAAGHKEKSLMLPDAFDAEQKSALGRYLEFLTATHALTAKEDQEKLFGKFFNGECQMRGFKSLLPSESISARALSGQTSHLSIQVPSNNAVDIDQSPQYSPGGRPLLLSRRKGSDAGLTQRRSRSPERDPDAVAGSASQQPKHSSFQAYRPGPVTVSAAEAGPPSGPSPSTMVSTAHPQQAGESTRLPRAHSPSNDAPIPIEFADDLNAPSPVVTRGPEDGPPDSASSLQPKPLFSKQSMHKKTASGSMPMQDIANIAAIREDFSAFNARSNVIDNTPKDWETKVNAARQKQEADRRKRLEQEESRINGLFEDEEIGYADISALEQGSKDREVERQQTEEQEWYDAYTREVFEPIFHRFQKELTELSELYAALERPLRVAADASADVAPASNLPEALALLMDIHNTIETRKVEIQRSVGERDKRFRRLQTKPLHARGEFKEMKKMERGFELGERRANVKVAVAGVERCKRLWQLIDDTTSAGMDFFKDQMQRIGHELQIAAKPSHLLRQEVPGSQNPTDLATKVLERCAQQAKILAAKFDVAERLLNDAEFAVSVASARFDTLTKHENTDVAKAAEAGVMKHLSAEKEKEDRRLTERAGEMAAAFDHELAVALRNLSGSGIGVEGKGKQKAV